MQILTRNIFRILSIVFQPLLIPFYNLLLLSLYTDLFTYYKYGIKSFLLPVLLLTFIIPLMFTVVLRSTGYIKDLALSKANDRILPYLVFILSNASLVYIFSQVNVPSWFLIFLSTPGAIAFCGFIVNFVCRISIHMLALGNFIANVIFISFTLQGVNPYGLLIILFLVTGILAVSRLYLEKNTPTEIYIGFLLGLIFTYIYFNIAFQIVRHY